MLASLVARSSRSLAARGSNALIGARAPAAVATFQRFKTGPASGGEVSDEMLDKLATLSTQSLIDGLWVMGWPDAFIEGARPLAKGQKCAGRAVTLRFVPQRPDIAADKPIREESPEYEAFELCGPRNVLVMSSVGPWESVGGDIKFLRLKQLQLGGLVTDGSVRDTDEILNYGFPCFSYSTTPKQGPAAMQPWEAQGVISCGKVVVRPGDAIIGDQDGVVCVPASHAEQVYEIAHGREVIEEVIKEELIKSPCRRCCSRARARAPRRPAPPPRAAPPPPGVAAAAATPPSSWPRRESSPRTASDPDRCACACVPCRVSRAQTRAPLASTIRSSRRSSRSRRWASSSPRRASSSTRRARGLPAAARRPSPTAAAATCPPLRRR